MKHNYLDLQQENRREKVLSLLSKCKSQEEIAKQLGVDQSTISRDLKQISEESRERIKNANRNVAFEYERFFAGNEQVIKALWEIAESDHAPDPHQNSQTRDRIEALTQIEQCLKDRLQAAVGGPASEMNALRYASDMKNEEAEERRYKAMMKNDPLFRAVAEEEGTIS